ncbi:hypothetical protein BDY24DRAFT_413505 [Mrakia frigida]|uniref:RTP1-C1 domain-containing protein n=1 Tax=Mrakia frigida TaxID=29902 RepID=UPI003FCBFFF0
MSIPPSEPEILPILSSPLLLSALKSLYPIPRKNQPLASRPTQATLHSFLLQIPQAQQALSPVDDEDGFSLSKEATQKKFSRDLGLVALWSAEKLDERVREESMELKNGAAPVLPVSAPPLILTLLSHTITHVLQPLFLQSFPPPPKSAPPPSRSSSTASSSRFTEILPEVSLTPLELESRKESKNSLEITLARVLNLAVVRPVTEVGKLVRDGGVVRSVIKMAVAIGWEEAAEAEEKRDDLQKLVLRVLDSFRPTQTLGLLSPLLSSTVFPTHVSKAAGSLMTRALLRPGGVEGVLQGVFGGSEGAAETGREESDVGQKSLSVARVLGTVPGGMDAEEYYTLLIPRLIPLLTSPTTPSTYLRPLSLTLTTLLSHSSPLVSLPTQRILLPYIHSPLLSPHSHQHLETLPSAAFNALTLLLPLILLTPPSSTCHSILLGPILPQLFGLHWHLQQGRTADPVLRREVEGCLRSWGRVGEEEEVRRGLEEVVRSGRGWEGGKGGVLPGEEDGEEEEDKEWYWEGGGENLKVVWGCPPPITSSSSTSPSSSTTSSTEVEQQTLTLLSLHPPPNLFLAYLKSLDRPSLAGDLFVSLLNQLDSPSSSSTTDEDEFQPEDPRRRVLLMQIVLSMVDSMGETLVKGEEGRVLAFVAHVLANSAPKASAKPKSDAKGKGREVLGEEGEVGGLKSLRIVDSDDEEEGEGEESDGLDSDDEVELPVDEEAEAVEGMFGGGGGGGGEGEEEGGEEEAVDGGGKLGLVGTAIGLLVAVLQANDDLSPSTSPILTLIQSSLEHHLNSSTPSIRHLTREARLLISVREATSSSSTNSSDPTDPKTEATNKILDSYRQALKLVQDPLVPVRAHGLITLRQLVLPPAQQRRERPGTNPVPRSTSDSSNTATHVLEQSLLPPALVPAILDVFLQSVQDPDSYVYLNAVKGLSALVDGWGRDVLGRMIGVYAKGVGNGGWEGAGGEMERAELDARLRVGEALCGVVERSEGGLGVYASTLIPPLLLTFRAVNLPTALRSSALTILTIISSTSPLTIAPYASDLVLACVDLLQVESVPMAPHPTTTTSTSSEDQEGQTESATGVEEVLAEEDEPVLSPLLSNPKHPILRRAALHFTSSVLRADPEDMGTLDREVWRRATVVVGYVGATDVDLMVRGLAGDVKADLKKLAI